MIVLMGTFYDFYWLRPFDVLCNYILMKKNCGDIVN